MVRRAMSAALGMVSILASVSLVSAETLRCRSVNGNVTCAGSGAVSCQTIDGRRVCVSGHGDVVQSFGGGQASPDAAAHAEAAGEPGEDALDENALDEEAFDDRAPAPHARALPPRARALLRERP